jgi:hypothetical protein
MPLRGLLGIAKQAKALGQPKIFKKIFAMVGRRRNSEQTGLSGQITHGSVAPCSALNANQKRKDGALGAGFGLPRHSLLARRVGDYSTPLKSDPRASPDIFGRSTIHQPKAYSRK